MKLKSGYGILDVTDGRKLLRDELKRGKTVSVVIIGEIDQAMNDDGTSQEFSLHVRTAEVVSCT